jgi:nicotinamidase-related amidase
MKILAKDTMALVIDLQDKLMSVINEKELVISNTVRLVKGLGILEVPLVVTQQYTKGLGMTIEEIQQAVGESFEYEDKITFSCMGNLKIREKIESMNRKNVIICGAEAHICVLQTVIDLIKIGYNVLIVADCVGSRKDYDKEIGFKRIVAEGGVLTTYESILFEMTNEAGTETFKKISKLVKPS